MFVNLLSCFQTSVIVFPHLCKESFPLVNSDVVPLCETKGLHETTSSHSSLSFPDRLMWLVHPFLDRSIPRLETSGFCVDS